MIASNIRVREAQSFAPHVVGTQNLWQQLTGNARIAYRDEIIFRIRITDVATKNQVPS
jgi:hypothetical protein